MEWHAGMKALYEKADAMRDMGAGWHPTRHIASTPGSLLAYVADEMGYELDNPQHETIVRAITGALRQSGWLDIGLGGAIVELRCDVDMDDDSWNTFAAWDMAENMALELIRLYWRD